MQRHKGSAPSRVAFSFLIAVLLVTSSGFAQTSVWINPSGGDFTNPVNWSAGVPSTGNVASFLSNDAYAVTWTGNVTNNGAVFNGVSGIVTQNLAGYTWVITNLFHVGQNSGSTATVVQVGGTLIATNANNSLNVGFNGNGTYVLSEGTILARSPVVGRNSPGGGSYLLVTGGNSILSNVTSSATIIGSSDTGGNRLTVANSGRVDTAHFTVGSGASSDGNTVLITDDGSFLNSFVNSPNYVGNSGAGNQLILSNGGRLFVQGEFRVGNSSGGDGNVALITGDGSLLTNVSATTVGNDGSNNQLIVTDGGRAAMSRIYAGRNAASSSNLVLVTGSNSVLNALGASAPTFIGDAGSYNRLVVSNGGQAAFTELRVGNGVTSTGNTATVTGPGSILISSGTVTVGSNSSSKGIGGSILVRDGGLLQANTLFSGLNGSGIISNAGGIYQFTTANPTFSNNSPASIVVNGGTISFRGIVNASPLVIGTRFTNLTYQGDNTFQLNNATNATVLSGYLFDSVANTANPSNYQRLALINDAGWRSTTLTIGSGGSLLISNSVSQVNSALTSTGGVTVVNSVVRYASNVTISGAYVSDPSTNIFSTNTTVTASGWLQGGAGDLFQFERNLSLQSTNRSVFDLSSAMVLFTNGSGSHVFDLTGSDALDHGTNFAGISSVLTNFAIGTLLLAPSDSLQLTGAVGNALYVGALDFGGLANTNNLILDVNLYYDSTLAANSYLGTNTFDLSGAGMLIPYPGLVEIIPEPSLLSLLLLSGLFVLARKR